MAFPWRYPGSRGGRRNRRVCGCPIAILGFLCVLASSILFFGLRIYNRSPSNGDDYASSSWKLTMDWRERMALQTMKSVFSKEVLDVITASTADLGPFSLDSFRKWNLSESWKVNGVEDSAENIVSFETSDADQGTLNSEEEHQLRDTPEKLYKRQLRQERREALANDLVQRDAEVIMNLEEAAIERSKSVDSAVLGNYNIWANKKEKQNSDSMICLMRDQIIMARVYVSIAKMKNQTGLLKELEIQLVQSQQALGEPAADIDLDQSAPEAINTMGKVLSEAREELYDFKLVTCKLRAMLQAAEEELVSLKTHGIFLSQLAAKALPNAIHCLSMHLTLDYHFLPLKNRRFPRRKNLENINLYHYAVFSDNVLAASVVVNSTVMNAKDSSKHVFHLVTDKLNFGAMNMWFLLNPPGNATIHIKNFEEFKWLNSSYCPVLRQLESAAMKEYYFKTERSKSLESGTTNLKYRNPKYMSMLNHLRFYLPQVYPKLDKILFLDDDVVVQQDLSPLWSVDLNGKVNGAVETCGGSFHRFDKYLNFSNPHILRNFDPKACGWAYGMNIFDLKEWKKMDLTNIYHKWQNLNEERALWKLGTLPPGLITFYNLTHPLDKSWHTLGLGFNPSIDQKQIENAAVIHYNGHKKPWLEMAVTKYQPHWTRYINIDHPYLQRCNWTKQTE